MRFSRLGLLVPLLLAAWVLWSLRAESAFDLFRFSDAPIMERLHFHRTHVEGEDR